jgi:hypothetical protein
LQPSTALTAPTHIPASRPARATRARIPPYSCRTLHSTPYLRLSSPVRLRLSRLPPLPQAFWSKFSSPITVTRSLLIQPTPDSPPYPVFDFSYVSGESGHTTSASDHVCPCSPMTSDHEPMSAR